MHTRNTGSGLTSRRSNSPLAARRCGGNRQGSIFDASGGKVHVTFGIFAPFLTDNSQFYCCPQ